MIRVSIDFDFELDKQRSKVATIFDEATTRGRGIVKGSTVAVRILANLESYRTRCLSVNSVSYFA